MSGRLVSAVFESALPAWLKPYASVYASFAADDGSRVYPTRARVARMVGRSERSTQVALRELRRLGVLVLECPHAPARAARYVFDRAALPAAQDPGQLALFPQAEGRLSPGKTAIGDDFHRFPQAYTGSVRPVMGEAHNSRSVNDPKQLLVQAPKGKARAS